MTTVAIRAITHREKRAVHSVGSKNWVIQDTDPVAGKVLVKRSLWVFWIPTSQVQE